MSVTKKAETRPRFETVIFQNKFTSWHIRLNIYIWKTKFSSHKHYLFGLLFSRNAEKTHTDQSILLTFLLWLKRNASQTLKSSSRKKVFPKCVYIMDTTCFDECFLFRVITRRHSFLYKLIVTQKFGSAMLLRTLKQVYWKKSVFYIYYFHNNISMLLIPQCSYFLNVLNKIYFLIAIFYSFSMWMFHIFFINGIFKT